MHISEQVAAELIAQGFVQVAPSYFEKMIETGGQFGTSKVVIHMDMSEGRYLERRNGWMAVERDVDLRNYQDNPKGAIAAVMA